jgi:hypothetical protein
MVRLLSTACLVGLIVGCQVPAERAAMKALPEGVQPVPYAELLTRARAQVDLAVDAFNINHWNEVEEAAKGLEQTARFLPKAEDVPPRTKDALVMLSTDLGKEAAGLREAATAMSVDKASEAIKRVNLKVRELRLDN